MATMDVSVVSAEALLYEGAATEVYARSTEGEIGILPGHEPMLAILAAGEVRITELGGGGIKAKAEDGFLSVEHDMVTIVARYAELVQA